MIKEENGYKYLDEGEGEPLILLHGLIGALSNWDAIVNHFSGNYRVIIPSLPIYSIPVRKLGLETLTDFVEEFVDYLELEKFNLMGNSLGGHIALIYALRKKEKVNRLILTGSSGLFENSMGGSYPKRGNYEYIKERTEYTFYNPKTATTELIDHVFDTMKSIQNCLSIVAIAKSAQRTNMSKDLQGIVAPTLLIWGLNDTITPPYVAHEFDRLIPNTTLKFIDECCHAPMMEKPDKFNDLLDLFLNKEIIA
jgi:pimeloyl-ACP methyl ester carboxylesterase